MPKLLKILAFASTLAAAATVVLYGYFGVGILLTLSLTFATTAYHFIMRLTVGGVVSGIMKNRADYHKGWYRERAFERRLYRMLGVKRWKDKLPVYRPEDFSRQAHTFSEMAQAMCQAEVTHEIIVVLSFVPLLASVKFDAFFTWLLTSILAAGFDLLYVMIQRYNRPRVVRLAEKQGKRS